MTIKNSAEWRPGTELPREYVRVVCIDAAEEIFTDFWFEGSIYNSADKFKSRVKIWTAVPPTPGNLNFEDENDD